MKIVKRKSNRVPIIILNGFLGSGKTTLFRNLLGQSREKNVKVCAIVNDMSELDVDGQLIGNTTLIEDDNSKMHSINSCVLSSRIGLQKLDSAIQKLLDSQNPECIIIETSGSCHPMPLVKYFRKHEHVELTALLVLVDCLMMAHDYNYGETLIPIFKNNLALKTRDTHNLLVEQILFCSHLILTKPDRIEHGRVNQITNHVKNINPFASVNPVVYGRITIESLLAVEEYNYFNVEQLIKELEPLVQDSNTPFEICTMVLRDDRPFHPKRLWDVCHNYLDTKIYRSKGFFWLASRSKYALLWNQSGGDINLEIVGTWRKAILEDDNHGLIDEEISFLKKKISSENSLFGDRHCNLTVIGNKSRIDKFTKKLKACFLTEEEIKMWNDGFNFVDPWPQTIVRIKN